MSVLNCYTYTHFLSSGQIPSSSARDNFASCYLCCCRGHISTPCTCTCHVWPCGNNMYYLHVLQATSYVAMMTKHDRMDRLMVCCDSFVPFTIDYYASTHYYNLTAAGIKLFTRPSAEWPAQPSPAQPSPAQASSAMGWSSLREEAEPSHGILTELSVADYTLII